MSGDWSTEDRIKMLELRVDFLESQRPGRKLTPIVASIPEICGVDPSCDSRSCDMASLYRYQRGCRGISCSQVYSSYYDTYRKTYKERRKSQREATAEENLD
jgi:hypothetical protein